ncbi:sugar ABC transporter permease [Marivivens donghaensis]|uniref:Sugar ABC transporter permease n=1 Tax=Marivivens donghaensis TaxID=1699413 RepID=A0ABX0VW85_9RHOB|nr:sugar ABC transporter permease [Marivivens donghaensis]NIY71928.1 sugar ABC transporter permease [Marivivens donghaensis]
MTNRTPQRMRRDGRAALIFLAPFLIIYCVFLIFPLFKAVFISFHDWELAGGYREWIGFFNYEDLWYDDYFWKALGNTMRFAAMAVPSMTILALLLALGLHGHGRVRAVLRSVFFSSSVFSVTVVTLVWQMVLSPDRGLIAPIFRSMGMEPINFLGSVEWAMPSLVIATLWWGVGLPMALFLAALGQIPDELYEAAELDHASRWSTLRYITLPGIRHTVLLVLVLQIVGQFQIFGQAQLMTKGGPANTTLTLVQYIYNTGFRDWQVGYATTIALALFVVMAGFSMLQLWLGRKGDDQ